VFCVKFLKNSIIVPSFLSQIASLLKNMTSCYSILSKGRFYKGLREKYETGKILSKNISLTTGKSPPLHSRDCGRPRSRLPKSEVVAFENCSPFLFYRLGVFVNRVLRKILGPKRIKVTWE